MSSDEQSECGVSGRLGPSLIVGQPSEKGIMKATAVRAPSPIRKKPKTLPASRRRAGNQETVLWVPSILKIKSILVPVDFSEPSRKALKYAVSFAEQFGAKLTLLHVVEPVVLPDFVYTQFVMEPDKLMEVAKVNLELLGKEEGLGPKLIGGVLVRAGRPFEEITEAARGLKSDLIILATRGHTGLKHAWLGSTAERVIRHAPCPVLSVREHERDFL